MKLLQLCIKTDFRIPSPTNLRSQNHFKIKLCKNLNSQFHYLKFHVQLITILAAFNNYYLFKP